MHDIHWIKENPDAFDAGLARRKMQPMAQELLALDAARREGLQNLESLKARRNQVAKEIPVKKKAGEDVAPLIEEGNRLKSDIARLEAEFEAGDALSAALASLPNILADDVPKGADEADNIEIKKQGAKPEFAFAPKDHVALGEALEMMDFKRAAKLSGARFVVLSSALARLERALAALMIDIHTGEFGYTEYAPPYLVRDEALFGTGQLPKFSEDLFKTENGYWLIPTAEVALTNLVAGDILDAETLPLRMTALTPCFRSEAGSAGKDTRGMIRQHQFSKVELVSITAPEDSLAEHERMLSAAETVLKRLGLHYRVVTLCEGDTGFGAKKTYDIEVWMPGQNAYREISSCSNCGDFQARRMKARMRQKGEKQTQFVHTLNGSGLAVGRTLIAVLENYQQEDGSIKIPEALVPYMGGVREIKGMRGIEG